MRAAVAAGLLAVGACAGEAPAPDASTPSYRPNRLDYRAFAAAREDLLEPNYLPFMAHQAADPDGGGDVVFFCRWAHTAMPLAVRVEAAAIPDALQDEFDPREPEVYPRAVSRALATWERELDGAVRFRAAEDAERADLTVRLVADRAPAPEPDLQVLGVTPLRGACRVRGRASDGGDLRVAFQARELRIFLADEAGLLRADQVEWIALHEIGHALGMRGHSPIPTDTMYELARDRMIVHEGVSEQDVNSFLSLYALPNGTVFARVPAAPEAVESERFEEPEPSTLALAPFVDARRGFSLRPPAGWTRVRTRHGMVAVHGVTWDYDATFQIVVERFATIDDYMSRYAEYYARRGELLRSGELTVDGRRALQAEIAFDDGARIEQVTLVEVGDGRVLVVTADSPADRFDHYLAGFEAALASLEIQDLPEDAWPPRRPVH